MLRAPFFLEGWMPFIYSFNVGNSETVWFNVYFPIFEPFEYRHFFSRSLTHFIPPFYWKNSFLTFEGHYVDSRFMQKVLETLFLCKFIAKLMHMRQSYLSSECIEKSLKPTFFRILCNKLSITDFFSYFYEKKIINLQKDNLELR